ncbi:MAG: hypothetical protein V3R91_06830 [Myxococcota bacterium]
MTDVRSRYEEYLEARERELILYRSGRRAAPELARIDEDFDDVTSGEGLDELTRALAAASFESTRDRLRRLRNAVQDAFLASRLRELELGLWERERRQSARVGSREARVREWEAAIAEEAEASRRTGTQLALDRAWSELNPLREELFGARGELLAGLGYASPRAWAEARRPKLDYEMWREFATRLLAATESVYRDGLPRALAAIGVAPETAHRGDVARIERLSDYDALFPAAKLAATLDFTLEGMAIRMGQLPGLSIDRAERVGKQLAAFCAAPRPPHEVFLVAWPRPGVPAYAGFLHEAGRALGYLFTSPELPVERRSGADAALEEAWGALLSSRLADPEWIAMGPPAARAESYAPDIRLRRCAMLRRCAAMVRFELELASLEGEADPGSLAALYQAELEEATGCRWGPEGYLIAAGSTLASVDRLRGWCLEAQLSELLRERFGRRFWRERAAGALLKELWNTGATYSAEEIASELGLGTLAIDPLIETCLHL